MKRLWVILTIGLIAFVVLGADKRYQGSIKSDTKKVCRGYTVIEASIGIDCNGDTLRLKKVGGYYERIRQDETKSAIPLSVN